MALMEAATRAVLADCSPKAHKRHEDSISRINVAHMLYHNAGGTECSEAQYFNFSIQNCSNCRSDAAVVAERELPSCTLQHLVQFTASNRI